MLLAWRDATGGDEKLLESFECTTPKPTGLNWRTPHPKPWELRIQSGIKTERPNRRGSNILLGFDGDGLAAVVSWVYVSRLDYKILAIAVARRHRGKTGAHAREALDNCLAVIQADAEPRAGAPVVYAWIHEKNWSSQKLFHQFQFVKGRQVTDALWEWARDLGTPSDMDEDQ